MPRSMTAESHGESTFSFIGSCQTVFLSGSTFLHSYQQCMSVPIAQYPHQCLVLLVFWTWAILISVKYCLIIVLKDGAFWGDPKLPPHSGGWQTAGSQSYHGARERYMNMEKEKENTTKFFVLMESQWSFLNKYSLDYCNSLIDVQSSVRVHVDSFCQHSFIHSFFLSFFLYWTADFWKSLYTIPEVLLLWW